MRVCKSCSHGLKDGNILGCTNCGAEFCGDCATTTKQICPYCYSSLEYIG